MRTVAKRVLMATRLWIIHCIITDILQAELKVTNGSRGEQRGRKI